MAMTETRPETGATAATASEQAGPSGLEILVGSGDHRTTGVVFIGFSLLFLVISFIVRALVGIDVLTDNGFLGVFGTLSNLSSQVGLVFVGVVPLILGLAIYVVPMQVGSPAIAFPRAVTLSLWTWVLGAGVFITSAALKGGIGGGNDDAARLGNVSLGVLLLALGLGTVAVMTTVVAHRPFGMGLARVPLFSWSMLVGGAVWLLSFGSAFAHIIVGQISQSGAEALATNFSNGIAWLLRAPSVYMIAIPVLGIAGDVVARAANRRLANYFVFQTFIGAFAVLSFGAWVQSPTAVRTAVWTVVALLIGLPVLGLLGGLADTLRRGRVKFDAAVIASLLSLLLLLGAVAAGLLIALDNAGKGELVGFNSAELAAAQAFFAVGAALVGAIAGLFGWSPLILGRPAKKGAATGAVLLTAGGTALMATTALIAGLVQLDGKDTGYQAFGVLGAIGAVVALFGVVATLAATLGAARTGDEEGAEELSGLTLEWAGSAQPLDAPPVQSAFPLLDTAEENA